MPLPDFKNFSNSPSARSKITKKHDFHKLIFSLILGKIKYPKLKTSPHMKNKNQTITVKNTKITILQSEEGDYISLTDMLQAKDGDFFIEVLSL